METFIGGFCLKKEVVKDHTKVWQQQLEVCVLVFACKGVWQHAECRFEGSNPYQWGALMKPVLAVWLQSSSWINILDSLAGVKHSTFNTKKPLRNALFYSFVIFKSLMPPMPWVSVIWFGAYFLITKCFLLASSIAFWTEKKETGTHAPRAFFLKERASFHMQEKVNADDVDLHHLLSRCQQ